MIHRRRSSRFTLLLAAVGLLPGDVSSFSICQ